MLFNDKTKKKIPDQTRKRAIALLKRGETVDRITKQLAVSPTTLKRWRAELRKGGENV